MEPRRLVNIHKICIVKHASKVCYMRPSNFLTPDSTKQHACSLSILISNPDKTTK